MDGQISQTSPLIHDIIVKSFYFMGTKFHWLTTMDMFVDMWIHGFQIIFINTQVIKYIVGILIVLKVCPTNKIQLNFVKANFIKMNNSLRRSKSSVPNRVLLISTKVQLFKSKYLCRTFYVSKHILRFRSGVFFIKSNS